MTLPVGISVKSYRGLRAASWRPEGVCLSVGPNGSGKSALLSAFDMMNLALGRQLSDAINLTGGYRTFRNAAGAPKATRVALEVGEASWELAFPPFEEDLWEAVLPASNAPDVSAALLLRLHAPTHMMGKGWERAKDEQQATAARDLYDAATRVAVYAPWNLHAFRDRPLSDASLVDRRLAADASNVFVVLQNWKNEDATEERFVWVRKWLREIQPTVGTLELEKAPGLIGGKLTLQEAFIKIWRHLNAFNPQLRLSSWMYRIVHNEAVSTLRKKTSFGKDHLLAIDESLQARLAAEWPDLSYSDETEDQENAIRSALAELPLPHREVLVLRFMEDMSYEDSSDVLKIPEGTVATRLNRAKKALAGSFATHSSKKNRA